MRAQRILSSLQAGGRQRETDLVVEELERAQQRVAEMEAERVHAMQKKQEAAAATPDDGGYPRRGAPWPPVVLPRALHEVLLLPS